MSQKVWYIGNLISLILFVGGVIDIVNQYLSGQSIQWRVPLFLLGAGAMTPIVLFPFRDISQEASESNYDYDDEDLSTAYENSPSFFLKGSSGESDASSGYSSSGYDGGGDGGGGD